MLRWPRMKLTGVLFPCDFTPLNLPTIHSPRLLRVLVGLISVWRPGKSFNPQEHWNYSHNVHGRVVCLMTP
jgi:hypothetical protein